MSKLQDQLDQITANTRNLVQPERLEISERAVAELYAAGVEDRILQVGMQARSLPCPTPRAASCAAPTCWPWGRWSSISSAGAGALTASPSLRVGEIYTTPCANAARY